MSERTLAQTDQNAEACLVPAKAKVASVVIRTRLFVGSYAPLFAILAIRFEGAARWISAGIAALAFVSLWRLVRTLPANTSPDRVKVDAVSDEGGTVTGYLASYLLPFLTVPEPGWRDAVSYVIFLVVSATVYVNSDMLHVNPTLYLFGRRVVKATVGRRSVFIIARREILPGDRVRKTSLYGDVLVEANDDEDADGV